MFKPTPERKLLISQSGSEAIQAKKSRFSLSFLGIAHDVSGWKYGQYR